MRFIAKVIRISHAKCQGQGQGQGLDTCYSATYMSETRDQQRFTISEVAADWHDWQGCLQWTGCESNPQPLGYESDTLPTGPLHPPPNVTAIYLQLYKIFNITRVSFSGT